MSTKPNVIVGRRAFLRYNKIVSVERGAIGGIGNSNILHGGNGWDDAIPYALHKLGVGLWGAGPYSVNDNGGNGSGAGYYFGCYGGGAYTGAPAELAAYHDRGDGLLFPSFYGYYATLNELTSNTGNSAAVVNTKNSTVGTYVPTLTGYTGGGVTVSASSEANPTDQAWKAFDGTTTNYWAASSVPAWVKMVGPSAVVTSYTLTNWNFVGGSPTAWQLQGSNDGTNWTVLDSQTGQLLQSGSVSTFTVATPGSYSQYRLYITAVYQEAYAVVGDLQLTTNTGSYPDSPWDARDGLKFSHTHGTFTTGSGKLTVTLDPTASNGATAMAAGTAGTLYGVRSPTVNTSAGSYGMTTTAVELAANTGRTAYDSYAARIASASAVAAGTGTVNAPHFGLWWQFEQPARNTGVAYTTIDYRGGQPIRALATDLLEYSDLSLTLLLTRMRAPLGPSKAVLIIIQELQNHRNDDAGTSVGPNPTSGDSAAAFADNAQAIINRFKAIYAANGWSTANLFFGFIGDHNITGAAADDAQCDSYREILATQIVPNNDNTFVIDLAQLLDGVELMALNYYAGALNTPHMSEAGYRALALKLFSLGLIRGADDELLVSGGGEETPEPDTVRHVPTLTVRRAGTLGAADTTPVLVVYRDGELYDASPTITYDSLNTCYTASYEYDATPGTQYDETYVVTINGKKYTRTTSFAVPAEDAGGGSRTIVITNKTVS